MSVSAKVLFFFLKCSFKKFNFWSTFFDFEKVKVWVEHFNSLPKETHYSDGALVINHHQKLSIHHSVHWILFLIITGYNTTNYRDVQRKYTSFLGPLNRPNLLNWTCLYVQLTRLLFQNRKKWKSEKVKKVTFSKFPDLETFFQKSLKKWCKESWFCKIVFRL